MDSIGINDSEYSLIRLVGALAYDADDHVFLFESGHIGMGFFCTPISGVTEQTLSNIRSLLNNDFPPSFTMQFTLWSSPDIEPLLQRYISERSGCENPLLREMMIDRMSFLREGADQPPSSALAQRVNQQLLLVTFKLQIATAVTPADKEIEKLKEIAGILSQNLRTVGIHHEAMTAQLYLRVMQTILNWGKEADWRQEPYGHWDTDQLLALQVLDGGNAIHSREDAKRLRIGDKHIRMLSVKTYPESIINDLPVRYIQHPLLPENRGVTWPMLLTVNMEFPSKDMLRAKWETEKLRFNRVGYDKLVRFNPRVNQLRQSLDLVTKSVNDGYRPVRAYLGLALFGDSPGDVSDAVTHVKAYYHSLGFRLTDDAHAHLPLFGNLLPFGLDPVSRSTLSRFRHMTSEHLAPLLPVYGDWQGTGTPLLTLMSRSGQIMPVDPHDTDTNMNVVIAAASGSGKSFLTNELITNMRMRGDQVIVIDIGRSYRGLARMLHGQFVDFVKGADICINPFTDMEDYADEEDSVCDWLMAMASVNEVLNDLQIQQLKRVVGACWAKHGQALSPDIIAKACVADDMEEIQRIGHQLYPFTREGAYGRYVNGRNNVRFDADFVVLELEELKQQRQLQRIVLLQLIYQVDRTFYRGKRDRKRALIIDEAWDLFGHGEAANFITKAYRRFRKYGAMAVSITQSVNDLYMSQETTAIAENSAHMYLLKQNTESIAMILKESRLQLPEFAVQLLKSLRTVQGEYSEVLCKTPFGVGVGRLVVSDFCKQLFTTKAEEVQAIEDELAKGGTVRDAIARILERKGKRSLRIAA